MKKQTWERITGTGVVDGDKVKTTYVDISVEIPESAADLTTDMSDLSWDELAEFGYAHKKYLQFQSMARNAVAQEEAEEKAASTPIGRKAESTIATQVRNADKAGKLTAEQKARIAAVLADLD